MAINEKGLWQALLDKFSRSRDFTISFVLHMIIVMVFGTSVLFHAVQEPPDFEGGPGGFVEVGDVSATPPPQQTTPQQTTFNVTTVATPTDKALKAITTTAPSALNFTMSPTVAPVAAPTTPSAAEVKPKAVGSMDKLDMATAAQIKQFTGGWGKKTGPGVGIRQREFEFVAYLGQYSGGNWHSTVRWRNGRIETGSLPNLLFLMSHWSRDRITTNYKNVKPINLASDEIFAIKPPFIFFTGTRDFKLSEKEVENLRKYVRVGGCIWGDSSVPGLRSRFDIAFRREMKRVIPDVDKDFEPLPPDHPIFTSGYFQEIREVVPGINNYADPVQVMSIFGEIAIIYTSNDYGDMWQTGLNKEGQIDTRVDEDRDYVAISGYIFGNRGVYIRNVTPESLAASYKFGTNIVVHLLTRWEAKTRNAPTL